MKNVKYKGLIYEVPNWTRFMATDESGEVYAHAMKPAVEDNIWCMEHGSDLETKWCRVYPEDWKDSLVEIEE